MTEQNHIAVTQAILVGLCLPEGDPEETEKSLDELERLLETAGGSCFAKVVQNKDHPDPRTCVEAARWRRSATFARVAGSTWLYSIPNFRPRRSGIWRTGSAMRCG